MKRVLLALALVVGFAADGFSQALPEWSIWQNERGSLLIVTGIDAGGAFSGTFLNNAPGYRCRGFSAPISGTTTADSVTFVANFAPCSNTITIWKGKVQGNTLATDWNLVRVDENYEFKQLSKHDVFTRLK